MWRDPALRALSHQHQHGLALCVILDRTLREDDSDEAVARLAGQVLQAWEVEIRGHFQVEEAELFPAIRSAIAEPALVDALLDEHRRIETLEAELRQNPSADGLRRFALALSAHIRSEERRLFEQIQEALDPAAIAGLGERLDAAVDKTCPVTKGLPWEAGDSHG